jgi:hypothetical protein
MRARLRTRPRGDQRGPTAQPAFRQALLAAAGLAVAALGATTSAAAGASRVAPPCCRSRHRRPLAAWAGPAAADHLARRLRAGPVAGRHADRVRPPRPRGGDERRRQRRPLARGRCVSELVAGRRAPRSRARRLGLGGAATTRRQSPGPRKRRRPELVEPRPRCTRPRDRRRAGAVRGRRAAASRRAGCRTVVVARREPHRVLGPRSDLRAGAPHRPAAPADGRGAGRRPGLVSRRPPDRLPTRPGARRRRGLRRRAARAARNRRNPELALGPDAARAVARPRPASAWRSSGAAADSCSASPRPRTTSAMDRCGSAGGARAAARR